MQAGFERPAFGIPTFLFSDVEGSTQRWERDRTAMALALERHDGLMRAAIERHGGRVFKTVGDAFCAVFPSVSEALAAALDAQRSLAAEDFKAVDGLMVRMAVHTGEAQVRDGDYFGPALNRVARLMAIAHGAQVVVSGPSAELAGGALPSSVSLLDLGVHRLRDLAGNERVYQLVAPGLRSKFPALRSLDSFPNNLPRQLNSFVGRDSVEREIVLLLEQSALVTLTGSGGVGKTRCAVQVAAAMLEGTPDGVWLVELASLTDGSLLASAVAQALNVSESSDRSTLQVLLAYLKTKHAVLILDNCEHVIDSVAALVETILRACPNVRILATSRQSLNVEGERVYRMPSLAVPPPGSLSASEAADYGAVALFGDRALAVDTTFRLTDENVADVVEICRHLDGIPLALQLAASRVVAFPPRELAKRLDERFRLLTSGSRNALPRQQTMRALIDWSYDLLGERERAIFRRVSIFAGGFTSALAVAVCADEAVDEFDVLDILASLVDKSMVTSEPGAGGAMRYRLLESTRQYASEKLAAAPDERETFTRAHANAFVQLAERLERDKETMPDAGWYGLVEPELENWRSALTWALDERRDIVLGARLAGALHPLWSSIFTADGRRWVPLALATIPSDAPPEVFAKLHLADAALHAALLHQSESYEAAFRALSLYEQIGDAFGIASARDLAGSALVLANRLEEGEQLLRAALVDARRLGLRRIGGFVLIALGIARDAAGDLDAARIFFNEAIESFRAISAERLITATALNLSETEFRAGNLERALQLSEESLEVHLRWNDIGRYTLTLANMAAYLVRLERWDEARARAREVIELERRGQLETVVIWAVQRLAAIAALHPASDDDLLRAARLLGYVDARATAVGYVRGYTEQQECDALLVALRSIGEDTLRTLRAEGAGWDDERGVREALA